MPIAPWLSVAHPRRIVPGETYLITRRCYQRTFRLRPCAETNRIFKYCLALALQKTGVRVHAACIMSNHHHLVVTDPHGVLPDFLREFHRLTAKAMNASQDQWENLWAAEPCNVVRLVTGADIEEKITYVVANPVAAGLVPYPEDWPGFLSWGTKTFRVERPRSYFCDDGTCPAELVLEITQPPAREAGDDDLGAWQERVASAISERVAAAHRAMRAAGREFVGRKSVLASSFVARAKAHERGWQVVPTVAALQSSVRLHLLRVERMFRAQYRSALEQWRAGWRAVVFPWGTWAMRMMHAVAVEAPVAS